MTLSSVPFSTRAASSPQWHAESGSQTTEYALIMVVTATKLRQYD
jgi:hypothetical protein